jgi:CheY-like chemotaxis protein
VGIAAYKISAALKGVVAQRLVRHLCGKCRQLDTGPVPAVIRTRLGGSTPYKAAACDECSRTGYRGRLAIAEVLVCDAEVERRITAGDATQRIHDAARLNGMQSLWESAIGHVRTGATSVDEVMRVLEAPPDHDGVPELPAVPVPEKAPSSAVRERAGLPATFVFEGRAFDLLDQYQVRATERRRVLIAHPAGDACGELRRLMVASGFDVQEAIAGSPALDAIDRQAPEAILLDLGRYTLPPDILQRLCAHTTRRTPVIVVTGHHDDDTEAVAFDLGASDYISRPLRARVLVARVKAAIETATVIRKDDERAHAPQS